MMTVYWISDFEGKLVDTTSYTRGFFSSGYVREGMVLMAWLSLS